MLVCPRSRGGRGGGGFCRGAHFAPAWAGLCMIHAHRKTNSKKGEAEGLLCCVILPPLFELDIVNFIVGQRISVFSYFVLWVCLCALCHSDGLHVIDTVV